MLMTSREAAVGSAREYDYGAGPLQEQRHSKKHRHIVQGREEHDRQYAR